MFADKELGCAPLIVKFSNFSTGAISYLWKFGDGLTSTQTNPEHTFYSALGEYTVTLIAYDSGSNSDTAKLIIDVPSNLPYFNITDTVCPGKYVDFSVYGNSDSDNQIE